MPLNMRPKPKHGGDGGGFGGMPWLLCELAPVGKRMVRGSVDAQNFWTFCPLKKFPRDKIKIKECKGCKHFKGFRRSFTDKIVQSLEELGSLSQLTFPKKGVQEGNIQRGSNIRTIKQNNQSEGNQSSKSMNMKIIKKSPPPKKHIPTEEEIEQSLKEEMEKKRKWEKEEKKIFGDKD